MINETAWFGRELGIEAELRGRLEKARIPTRWLQAETAVLDRDYAAAADVFHEIGDLMWEAFARLRAAEQLGTVGRGAEAYEQLQRSLAFWRSVGAARFIGEGEALLPESA